MSNVWTDGSEDFVDPFEKAMHNEPPAPGQLPKKDPGDAKAEAKQQKQDLAEVGQEQEQGGSKVEKSRYHFGPEPIGSWFAADEDPHAARGPGQDMAALVRAGFFQKSHMAPGGDGFAPAQRPEEANGGYVEQVLTPQAEDGDVTPTSVLVDEVGNVLGEWLQKCGGASMPIEKSEKKDPGDHSGEGSKGGHVIGHTGSGKPIYDRVSHPSHASFTAKDHTEASDLHTRKARALKDKMRAEAGQQKPMAQRMRETDAIETHEVHADRHDQAAKPKTHPSLAGTPRNMSYGDRVRAAAKPKTHPSLAGTPRNMSYGDRVRAAAKPSDDARKLTAAEREDVLDPKPVVTRMKKGEGDATMHDNNLGAWLQKSEGQGGMPESGNPPSEMPKKRRKADGAAVEGSGGAGAPVESMDGRVGSTRVTGAGEQAGAPGVRSDELDDGVEPVGNEEGHLPHERIPGAGQQANPPKVPKQEFNGKRNGGLSKAREIAEVQLPEFSQLQPEFFMRKSEDVCVGLGYAPQREAPAAKPLAKSMPRAQAGGVVLYSDGDELVEKAMEHDAFGMYNQPPQQPGPMLKSEACPHCLSKSARYLSSCESCGVLKHGYGTQQVEARQGAVMHKSITASITEPDRGGDVFLPFGVAGRE